MFGSLLSGKDSIAVVVTIAKYGTPFAREVPFGRGDGHVLVKTEVLPRNSVIVVAGLPAEQDCDSLLLPVPPDPKIKS